jgi:Outer membrane protein beta-barrel domain
MKKLLLASVLVFGAVLFGYTQSPNTQFGLKAGLNVSSLDASAGSDFDSRTSFHLGGLAHIHVSKYFAVQPELYFSGQGGKNSDGTLKTNYINLPVLLQYMAGTGFRLQTGPQLGFLTHAEFEDGNIEVDVKDDYESVDFSWTFGASYIFPSRLGFDARYNLGLTNIRESSTPTYQNRVFSIGMFYQFAK